MVVIVVVVYTAIGAVIATGVPEGTTPETC